MEQRLSLITLGVQDLARARAFYEALGWRGQEVEQTVFFQTGGMALVLWGRDRLAADCGVPEPDAAGSAGRDAAAGDDTAAGDDGDTDRAQARTFGGMALAHNVRAREQVDQVLAEARTAGAVVTRPAADTFYGGYAGVFADPDGHHWEVAWNPGFPIAADGSVTVPSFG